MENTLAELSEDRAKERPYSPSNDANKLPEKPLFQEQQCQNITAFIHKKWLNKMGNSRINFLLGNPIQDNCILLWSIGNMCKQ